MIFFRKKKEEDVEEIKNLVIGNKDPENDQLFQMPAEEKLPEILENIGVVDLEEPEEKTVERKPVPAPSVQKPQVQRTVEQKQPEFAPVYIKIDKYKDLLNMVNEVKTAVIMIKNSLGLQKEIEGLRDENRKLMEVAISKIDKRIVTLDTEFLRPQGFEEDFPPPVYETEGLNGVVTDLKKQIEGLKSELQTIS